MPLPVRLLLFGIGPEIEPITELAGNLGWIVERFGHPSDLAKAFGPDAQTAALVMTHNFGRDLLALDRLLLLQLRYVGFTMNNNIQEKVVASCTSSPRKAFLDGVAFAPVTTTTGQHPVFSATDAARLSIVSPPN